MSKGLSNLDEIYWDLAKKYNLRKEQVEIIVASQFRFISNVISSSDIKDISTFKSINVTHLGKFLPRKKRIQKFHDFHMNKLNKENECGA